VALLLIGPWKMPAAAQDQVVYDEDVKLTSFESVVYSSIAQTAMVQGDVVIASTNSGFPARAGMARETCFVERCGTTLNRPSMSESRRR
jgi:hypothetical protein